MNLLIQIRVQLNQTIINCICRISYHLACMFEIGLVNWLSFARMFEIGLQNWSILYFEYPSEVLKKLILYLMSKFFQGTP